MKDSTYHPQDSLAIKRELCDEKRCAICLKTTAASMNNTFFL